MDGPKANSEVACDVPLAHALIPQFPNLGWVYFYARSPRRKAGLCPESLGLLNADRDPIHSETPFKVPKLANQLQIPSALGCCRVKLLSNADDRHGGVVESMEPQDELSKVVGEADEAEKHGNLKLPLLGIADQAFERRSSLLFARQKIPVGANPAPAALGDEAVKGPQLVSGGRSSRLSATTTNAGSGMKNVGRRPQAGAYRGG